MLYDLAWQHLISSLSVLQRNPCYVKEMSVSFKEIKTGQQCNAINVFSVNLHTLFCFAPSLQHILKLKSYFLPGGVPHFPGQQHLLVNARYCRQKLTPLRVFIINCHNSNYGTQPGFNITIFLFFLKLSFQPLKIFQLDEIYLNLFKLRNYFLFLTKMEFLIIRFS